MVVVLNPMTTPSPCAQELKHVYQANQRNAAKTEPQYFTGLWSKSDFANWGNSEAGSKYDRCLA